jgi:hypothetical protein
MQAAADQQEARRKERLKDRGNPGTADRTQSRPASSPEAIFAWADEYASGRDHRRVTENRDPAALPGALACGTQKPFSSLWKVTRSTRPAKTSVGVLVLGTCGIRA